MLAKLDLRVFCLRELVEWIEHCPCSFRGVVYGEDTFASRILSVAHDLGVEDPMDPMDAVEMVEGILADLETAKDDAGRDPWFVERLDFLKVAAEELCVFCVSVENRKTALDLANFEAELSGAKTDHSEYRVDNASVSEFPVHEIDGWSVSSAFEEDIVCKNTFLQAIRKVPGRPRACSVPSWWVPCREEKEEVINRDQLLDVPVASTGVESVLPDVEEVPRGAGRRLSSSVACRRGNPGRRLSPRVACRRGPGRRSNPRVSCRRGAGRRMSTSVSCRRCNAGRTLSPRVACRRGAGRRLSSTIACRRGNAGKRPSPRVACRRRSAGRRQSPRVASRRVLSRAGQALTRAFTRHGGHVFVASWWGANS